LRYVMNNMYFDGIKVQFLQRLVNYMVTTVIKDLFQLCCSNSVGVGLSLFHSEIEHWLIELHYHQYDSINVRLEPLSQAAKILLLPQKSDLLNTNCREKICPLIRPLDISQILSGYQLNETDSAPVPKEIIEEIAHLDSSYIIQPRTTFDSNRLPEPLHFDFPLEKLDLGLLEIPKIIMDKPGFYFLSIPSLHSSNKTPW